MGGTIPRPVIGATFSTILHFLHKVLHSMASTKASILARVVLASQIMNLAVLIVDDEVPLLKNLRRYLHSFGDRFRVLTATSAEEGLAILDREEGVDVLVTDVRLPGIDGIELVRHVKADRPELPIVVMSAYGTAALRRKAKAAGALTFLEKPVDLEDLRNLLEQATAEGTGWSGRVGGLDIFDVTQLLAMSGRSMAVNVTFGDRSGTLAFRNGRLVHASTSELAGEQAFFEMARWSGGTFEELPRSGADSLSPNVKMPFPQLMIEAARHRDEEAERLSQGIQEHGPSSSRQDSQPSRDTGKEHGMNIAKVNATLNYLKEELGAGLLATDIFAADDGQSIAGVNSEPKASALFNEVTDYLGKVLKGAGFPPLNRYYYLDLVDNKAVLVLSYGKFRHGLLMDSSKVKMGLLLNVYVPHLLKELPPALA